MVVISAGTSIFATPTGLFGLLQGALMPLSRAAFRARILELGKRFRRLELYSHALEHCMPLALELPPNQAHDRAIAFARQCMGMCANFGGERAYALREPRVLKDAYWPLGVNYRKTARWKALMQRPAFSEWQAEHDRIAAALAARLEPLD